MDSFRLIRTKLHSPVAADNLVERPHLIAQLNRGLECKLCLVAAPAGYGKSTAVSAWLEQCDCPSAWVSLDEYDNELRTFLSYFVAAVESLFPHICGGTIALLRAPDLPPERVLASTLINDLASINNRFIIVLDDFHTIAAQSIHDLLAELLQSPLPTLCLALVTRITPPLDLSKLRAHGQMIEVNAFVLRFSPEETTTFLKNEFNISVGAGVAGQLTVQTEGWVTGLRLTALSLRGETDIAARLEESLPGQHFITDYLVAETLAHQPPVIQDWLLKSAILDRFCAPLCDTVCAPLNEQDVRGLSGQDFMNWLTRTNLFVIGLDDDALWFRYHHLFQDVLQEQAQSRFSTTEIALLHGRASAWLAARGLAMEGLQHALLAGDTSGAVNLLAEHRHDLMNRESWRTLASWLRLFPADSVETNAELLLAKAWLCYYWWFDMGEWVRCLDQAEALMDVVPPAVQRQIECEVASMRSALLYNANCGDEGAVVAARALQLAPAEQQCVRSSALSHRSASLQLGGAYEQARDELSTALHNGTCQHPSYLARLLYAQCFIDWLQGDLNGVIEAGLQLRQLSETYAQPVGLSYARYYLGIAYYERNDLAAAKAHLESLIEELYQYPMQNFVFSVTPLALVYQANGERDRASSVLEMLSELAVEQGNHLYAHFAEMFKVEVDLNFGDADKSSRWAQTQTINHFSSMHRFSVPELTLAKALLAQDSAAARSQAADFLADLLVHATKIHNVRVQIEVLALRALLERRLGDQAAALETLTQALLLAAPGGWIRVFIDLGKEMATLFAKLLSKQHNSNLISDHATRVLAAFPADVRKPSTRNSQSAKQQPLIEPLTPRELDVLALMADGLGNKEIAAELALSLGTVKQYSHNIYQKLQVNNRMTAVETATSLDILPR